MDLQTCLKLLREIKDVAFATVDENNHPQVRIIDVMNVEDDKIYFLTAQGKDFYNQLINTKKVAIVGLTKDYESIRVNGNVHLLDNQKEEIDKIFELNPSMNDVYPGNSRYILQAFCVYEGEVEYFNLVKEPIFRESFSLNNYKIAEKGFLITDECLKCGLCYKNCPQKAIKDNPYKIQQEHCLHCGLCYFNCPNEAIMRIENDNN
ncbi:MAG: 4Fe-4S binding protein [Methanobrevibacter sp.]|uniref:4Fe-4S binding protein n=1 Tax=Methanobrevibacter sp. TaxID=66852 RepID=UPI0026E00783|nr:4Fe-4S binding protein [Methanobrevibacter sp.]MDO5849037.1 4Fe-4S binding protein [Methanobrevibacter sp.]